MKYKLTHAVGGKYNVEMVEECKCEELRAQLAECQRELDAWRERAAFPGNSKKWSLISNYELDKLYAERDAALERGKHIDDFSNSLIDAHTQIQARCKRLEEALREAEAQCTLAIRILPYDEGVQAIDQEIRPILRATLAGEGE